MHLLGDPQEVGQDPAPALGEGDEEAALVGQVALARDVAEELEALEQRGQRARRELDGIAQIARATRVVLVQGEHDEVLRVREVVGLEQRPVERDHRSGCGGEQQSHVAVEQSSVVVRHVSSWAVRGTRPPTA